MDFEAGMRGVRQKSGFDCGRRRFAQDRLRADSKSRVVEKRRHSIGSKDIEREERLNTNIRGRDGCVPLENERRATHDRGGAWADVGDRKALQGVLANGNKRRGFTSHEGVIGPWRIKSNCCGIRNAYERQ
jgi:hypothetical protein